MLNGFRGTEKLCRRPDDAANSDVYRELPELYTPDIQGLYRLLDLESRTAVEQESRVPQLSRNTCIHQSSYRSIYGHERVQSGLL